LRCLVAGGCGFIGHRVSLALRDAGHDVEVVDTLTDYGIYDCRGHRERLALRLRLMQGIPIHHADLRDSAAIDDLVRNFRPDFLVHLGNLPVASLAAQRPAYASEVIIGGTLTLLEMARRHGLGRFLYVSSSMVYGHSARDPVDEAQRCLPVDAYGSLKLSCEQLVRLYSESHGFEHSIVRPSAVYGPSGNETFVLSRFIDAARNSGVIRVFGRETKLDFTFVDDAVDGIVLALTSEKARDETFNIARGEARSLIEAAEWIAARFPGSRISMEPRDASTPRRGTMEISKARALLGFDPRISMEAGLNVLLKNESRSLSES
jgi:nucleoside-diphosphate-sugar epimerase